MATNPPLAIESIRHAKLNSVVIRAYCDLVRIGPPLAFPSYGTSGLPKTLVARGEAYGSDRKAGSTSGSGGRRRPRRPHPGSRSPGGRGLFRHRSGLRRQGSLHLRDAPARPRRHGCADAGHGRLPGVQVAAESARWSRRPRADAHGDGRRRGDRPRVRGRRRGLCDEADPVAAADPSRPYLLRAKRAFEALRQSEARLASAQRIARLGHWEQDLGTGDFHWSEQLSEIFGLPAGTLVANLDAALEYVHPDDRDAVRTARAAVSDTKTSRVDFRVLWADDTVRFMHENAEILLDELAEPARVVGTIQDITERKEAEERARYLANYDELTTLANRRLVVDQLGAALARGRGASRVVATLFVDLDHFKRINDSLGHAVGDRLLPRITARLRTCVRGSDVVGSAGEADEPSSPVIGRLGGDEFIVVLTDLPHPLDADRVARRIPRAIREPLTVEGHEIVVTATIGVSLFPNDGHDVDTLLRNADAGMYHAKERGRDDHQFYDLSMNATAIERLTLETELHRALEEDQFRLYFQPQVDSRTGYVTGAEALLRWQHPSRGLLAPEIFVALAEEPGLIVPIGEWIVREACAQAKAWNDAGHGPLRGAITLSARESKRSELRATSEP